MNWFGERSSWRVIVFVIVKSYNFWIASNYFRKLNLQLIHESNVTWIQMSNLNPRWWKMALVK